MRKINSNYSSYFQVPNSCHLNESKHNPNQFTSILHKFPHYLHKSQHIRIPAIGILLLTTILLVFLSACEKVIDVDLNESAPALVIEGNLSKNNGVLEVKVTRTTSYFDNEPAPKVENANVYLESGPGFHVQAEETEPGLYRLNNLPLSAKAVYRLTVNTQGEEYTAVSLLPSGVKIDSLGYEYQQEQIFFQGGYRILLYFTDPGGEDNYYRVKVYRNGERFDDADNLIVFDDSSIDGKNIQLRLRGQRFEAGDTARIDLVSIDKNAWHYFSTLQEVVNQNPGSPSPANPVSNFSNNALGYFSAWSGSTRHIRIPE